MRIVVTERISIDGLTWEPGEYDIEDAYWAMRLYERVRAAQQIAPTETVAGASGEEQVRAPASPSPSERTLPRRRRG